MEAVWLLAVLACPLVMGAMMLWMMRQMRGEHHSRDEAPAAEPSQSADRETEAAYASREPEERAPLDGGREEIATLAEEEARR
jgi:hypothetical protein